MVTPKIGTPFFSLSTLALVAACGEVTTPDATDAPSSSDAPDAAAAAWSAERVPNLNTTRTEARATATADHLEVYYYREPPNTTSTVLMVATRASAADPWGAPGVAYAPANQQPSAPEVSPDGLEIYFPYGGNVQRLARSSRTAMWPTSRESLVWPVSYGGIALSGDGLTAYYVDAEFVPRIRRRTSLSSPWGADETMPGVAGPWRYEYVTVSGDELTVVLSGPIANGAEVPPAVVQLTRGSTSEPFADLEEIVSLTEMPAFAGCDMFGPADEMYCHRDVGGQYDLFHARRGN